MPRSDDDAGIDTDLLDLADIPLAELADSTTAATATEDTLRRIAPIDGHRVLLVAASFNSAI